MHGQLQISSTEQRQRREVGRSGKMLQFNWTTEETLKSDLCFPSVTVQVDLTEADLTLNVLLEGRHPTPTSQAQGGHSPCLVSTSFLITVAIRHLKHKP